MDTPLSHAITGIGDPSGVGASGDAEGHHEGTTIEDIPRYDCEMERSPKAVDVSVTLSPKKFAMGTTPRMGLVCGLLNCCT